MKRLSLVVWLLFVGCANTSPIPYLDPPSLPQIEAQEVDGWTAKCDGVAGVECVGVARLFINNLARSHAWVKDQSNGEVTITTRLGPCLPQPDWVADDRCWQAAATTVDGEICMVVARQKPGLSEIGFGQAGGDVMTGLLTTSDEPSEPDCL